MTSSAQLDGFKPNFYSFDPEEVRQVVDNNKDRELADLTKIFKAKFFPNKELDIVPACKYTESVIGSRVVNSGYSFESIRIQIDFFNDLNRFEEAYNFCISMLAVCKLEDKKKVENRLVSTALLMEKPDRVKHLFTSDCSPDSSREEWVNYIEFHYQIGTIDALYLKPLPNDQLSLLYLYYRSGNFIKVIQLSDTVPPNCNDPDILAVLWLSNKKLTRDQQALAIYSRLITLAPTIISEFIEDFFIRELALETGVSAAHALNFVEKQRLARAFSLKLLSAASSLDPQKKMYRANALKLSSAFSSDSKRVQIGLIPGTTELKMELVFAEFKKAPKLSALVELINYYTKESKTEDLKKLYLFLDDLNSPLINFGFCHAIIKEALCKTELDFQTVLKNLDELLNLVPAHRFLLIIKTGVLRQLKQYEEAERTAILFFSKYGYELRMVEVVYKLYCDMERFDDAIDVLMKSYNQGYGLELIEVLYKIYKAHKSESALLQFFADVAFRVDHPKMNDFFIEASTLIKSLPERAQGIALLDSVPRGKNPLFIFNRANFYYKDPSTYEKSLKDFEFLSKFTDQYLQYNVILLAALDREEEAVKITLEKPFPNRVGVCEHLIEQLDSEERQELIIPLYEKIKPRSYAARKSAAFAYREMHDDNHPLPLLNELYKENPKDLDVIQGRIHIYMELKKYGIARDLLEEGLAISPADVFFLLTKVDLDKESKEQDEKKTEEVKPRTIPRRTIDPKRIPHTIEDKKEKGIHIPKPTFETYIPRVKQAALNLPSSTKGVDPLRPAFPLEHYKRIAEAGERSALIEEQRRKPAAVEAHPVRVSEPVKPIFKIRLDEAEKVFLIKGLNVLKLTLDMKPVLLDEKIVFNNYIYTILRLFTPLRINAVNEKLKENLDLIRNDARHRSDLVDRGRLSALFAYLRGDINLYQRLNEWIHGNGVITKLTLSNHVISESKREATPPDIAIQKVEAELEFIAKHLGIKSTWNDRVYHRNAIKTSISIIGESVVFLPEEYRRKYKKFLNACRENGNIIAHQFLVDGDTLHYAEHFQDEEIEADALWDLAIRAKDLFAGIKEKSR